MIARHPLAASVLALAAVIVGQARLGHPRRPGPGRRRHAGRLAVVLAGLVLPVGRPPGPGHVAGLVLPAPLGRGHDDRRGGALVSGPDPAARARQGHRHPVCRPGDVRLVSGQSAADFADHADNLAHGFGALLCRVRTARSGAVVLEFIRRDALAALVPALPIPAHPDLKALPVGRREDGLPWLVKLHGTHVLIAGATGAGKASLLWGLVRAMFPLMQDRPGPGPGRRPQADGAGLRPGHLRVLRLLRRRPGRHRRHAGPGGGRHAGPGCAGSPDASATTPPRSRTRSPWCWSMRWRS